MQVWLELHVDDFLLAKDPKRWPEAAALVDRLAKVIEDVGGQLSIRVRESFSSGDREGFLRGLQRRGHEVGAHAHGRDLAASVRALAGAGIVSPVMAPGLVQVGPSGRLSLLEQAYGLGARVITDRLESRHFSYQGWLAWEPRPGLMQMDVSVSPFDWGVLYRLGPRVEPAYGRLDWAALDRLAAVQKTWRAPEQSQPFFGATFHEHDVCLAGSLLPLPAMLDGLRRWTAKWRPRVSAAALADFRHSRSAPAFGAGTNLPAWTRPTRFLRPSPTPLPHRPKTIRLGPAIPKAALVVVHAGHSGLKERLRFLGLDDTAFPEVALWLYERAPGTPRAPGNPIHLADARTVLAAALDEQVPTVLLSWSGGCVPACRALVDLRRCDPVRAAWVRAFVDVEGPVDRQSLVPPERQAHEWLHHSPHDFVHWRELELVELLPLLSAGALPPTPYVRMQGSPDHVHGACHIHAQRAVEAAASARIPHARWDLGRPLVAASTKIQCLLSDLLQTPPTC